VVQNLFDLPVESFVFLRAVMRGSVELQLADSMTEIE
jgi:hypothetical protein